MSTVLHHFGSKERLIEACFEVLLDELDRYRDAELARLEGLATPHAALQHLVAAGLDFVHRHRRVIRLVMSEKATTGRTPAKVLERAVIPTLDALVPHIVALSGRSEHHARMTVITLHQLVVGYLLTEAAELAELIGVVPAPAHGLEVEHGPAVLAALETHLAETASRLVWGRDGAARSDAAGEPRLQAD